MDNCHAIVWIDHKSAHIITFNRSEHNNAIVRNAQAEKRLHHKAGEIGSGHVYEDDAYLGAVAQGVEGAETLLITGPSQVKWQLKAYLGVREPSIAERIAGVETLDHPTDAELLSLAQRYFKAEDRMRPSPVHSERHS
ncbi:MAG TPA: hypothetical protein VHL34_14145 [Rhizomicrobium sp.]|nr:hypothetical protein [Rhizomicrobium sp.]